MAGESAIRLSGRRTAEVILSVGTRGRLEESLRELGGEVKPVVRFDGASPADVILFCDDHPRDRRDRIREVARWAGRACPEAVLVLAVREGLAMCREAARQSGLRPCLILTPGGMPHAAAEAARLAGSLGVSATQVSVPVIGGDETGETRVLSRYTAVAGVPAGELGGGWREIPFTGPSRLSLIAAGVALAGAVIEDRREIFSCGGWVEGMFGIQGAFVSAPVPVGMRGAEEPLPLRLTQEERSCLLRAVRD